MKKSKLALASDMYELDAVQANVASVEAANANLDIEKASYYDTVALMKADTSIQVGTTVITRGYNTKGDGGGGTYNIRAKNIGETSATNWSTHFLNNGLVAELIYNGSVSIHQMGAKGDGTDDTTPFKRALSSGVKVTFKDNTTYLVNDASMFAYFANQYVHLVGGNNTKIKLSNSINVSGRTYHIYVETSILKDNVFILDNLDFEFEVVADNLTVEFTVFNLRNCKKLKIRNCNFISETEFKSRLSWFWLRDGNFTDVTFENTNLTNMGNAVTGGLIWSYDTGTDGIRHRYKFFNCDFKCNSRDELFTLKNAFDVDVTFDFCEFEADSLSYVYSNGNAAPNRDMMFCFQNQNGVTGKLVNVTYNNCRMHFDNIQKTVSIITLTNEQNYTKVNLNNCRITTTATSDSWSSSLIKNAVIQYTDKNLSYLEALELAEININSCNIDMHCRVIDNISIGKFNISNCPKLKTAGLFFRPTSFTPSSTAFKLNIINNEIDSKFTDTPTTLMYWLNQLTEDKCHYVDIYMANNQIKCSSFINNPANDPAAYTPVNRFTGTTHWKMDLVNNFVNGTFIASGYTPPAG